MMAKQIEIAVLVGDNGEWTAAKYEGADTDWSFMSDCIGIYDEKTRETVYPASERMYVLTATVELPAIEHGVVDSVRTESMPGTVEEVS